MVKNLYMVMVDVEFLQGYLELTCLLLGHPVLTVSCVDICIPSSVARLSILWQNLNIHLLDDP